MATLLKQYWWVILVIGAFIAFQSLKGPQRKSNSQGRQEDLPYALRSYLMSKAERSFFGVLEQATDQSKFYIFPQVSLASLVYVEKDTGAYQTWHNKIDRKSVDFVLFDRSTISPVLAIELDDSSHEREDRQERDIFVDNVLAKVGLPLLHVKAQTGYNLQQVSDAIVSAIGRQG